jgi:outer membrane lipoprotein-sorting protein
MRNSLAAIFGFLLPLAGIWAVTATEQAPLALERLPGIITGVPDHRAAFSEERRLTLLKEPVKLSGFLSFRAPDRFEKHTQSPRREDLVVEGEWVTVSSPDRKQEMRLNMSADPVLHGLLFSLQSLLTGRPDRLSEVFDVEAWGDERAWTLRMKPSAADMAARVQAVRVTGEGRWLRSIELWETSGDYLIMSIGPEMPG